LLVLDAFPFPEEFDDLFILMLAFRLNPAYERQLDPQSGEMLRRAKKQFSARYSNIIAVRSELGLIRGSRMTADRDYWQYNNDYYDPQYNFNFGKPIW